ncbi:putative HAF family extracellular repeat protein [Actinokineospora baliensis]|uniref:hypothetical protein n=1 Tax=Actinokineospora baliensis TaxID=547056 RepID=UPI0019561FED|nr:hypothetical protein [Actinokineospora baliensis]MBM7773533.1 putative HAF family extracellular repeat protein [Actinokineospora baliensis]
MRRCWVGAVVVVLVPVLGVPADAAFRSPLLTDGALPFPQGVTSAQVRDINDSGQIVGGGALDNAERAWLWQGNTVAQLGVGSPSGINNLGQVVGTEYVPGGSGYYERTPKVWAGGTESVLSGPSRSYVSTGDITDSGYVPVTYPNSVQGYHMENIGLWRDGTFTRLAAPTAGPHVSLGVVTENGTAAGYFLPMFGSDSYAFRCDAQGCARLAAHPGGTREPIPVAANESGVIVGNQNGVGLRWEGTQVSALPALAGAGDATVSSNRQAINERGDIVGVSGGRATLWRDGVAIELGSPAGGQSAAVAVNDLGDVVGWSKSPDGAQTRAFLWRAGRSYDLGTAGTANATPVALNNTGTIIGSSSTPDYRQIPLRWTVRPPR